MSPSHISARHPLLELLERAAEHDRLDRDTAASLRDAAQRGELGPDLELECGLLTQHCLLGILLPTALEALEEGGLNGFGPPAFGEWAEKLRARASASELKAAGKGVEKSRYWLHSETARVARSLGDLDKLRDGALRRANQDTVADLAITESALQSADRAIGEELLLESLVRVIQTTDTNGIVGWQFVREAVTKAVLLAFVGDGDALARSRRAARQVVPGGPAGHTPAEVALYERELQRVLAETLRDGFPLLGRGRSVLNDLLREMAGLVRGQQEGPFYGMKPRDLLDPAAHARLRASYPRSTETAGPFRPLVSEE